MPRLKWRNFNSGLWVAGGRDDCPEATLRRATGISQLKEGSVRSARGTRSVNDSGANQFVFFDGALFQSESEALLRDNVVVAAGFPQTGLGGARRASFLRMPPQPELVDWLFMAGGNNPFKVQSDGTTPSKWGIDAPADGMTATSASPTGESKIIDPMEDAGDWDVVGTGVVPVDDAVVTVSGGSVRWDFAGAGTSRYVNDEPSLTTDLTTFGSIVSPDQDYIDFYIRLSGDAAIGPAAENFNWMEIAFSLGDVTFDDNAFTRRIDGADGTVSQAGLATQQTGSGTYALDNNQTDADIVAGTGVFNEGADQRTFLSAIAQTTIMRQNDVWQRIRIPKATFDQVGSNTTLGWTDVQAARLTFNRSGQITIYVDQLALTGGYGLQGNYKYFQVFKNSITGSQSNPNPTATEVLTINRGAVTLGNIQQPLDSQIDLIQFYRTVGNGEAFFFAFEVAVGTLTATDTVVDFRGMYTATYILPADLPDVLQPDEVRLDNAPPPSTILGVLSHAHLARAWWLDSAPGNQGNLYFSPVGRPESTGGGDNGGFINVTTQTDNPLQKIVRWNDTLYVLSTNALYRIVGDDEPFQAQEVFGVPGCVQPDTVVETPFGIVWQATDGVRIFDGSTSAMLGFDALGPLFRGYDAEGLVAFEAVTAAYFLEDYVASDGMAQVLICNLRTQSWRHMGQVYVTLYTADDDITLYGAQAFGTGGTQSLDDPAADLPIDYEVQTPSLLTAVDTQGVVQRVFIDINSGGVQVTPTLVFEESNTVPLAPLATSARQTIEYARLDLSRLIAVRLDAEVETEIIELFGIEIDCFVPAGGSDNQ